MTNLDLRFPDKLRFRHGKTLIHMRCREDDASRSRRVPFPVNDLNIAGGVGGDRSDVVRV